MDFMGIYVKPLYIVVASLLLSIDADAFEREAKENSAALGIEEPRPSAGYDSTGALCLLAAPSLRSRHS